MISAIPDLTEHRSINNAPERIRFAARMQTCLVLFMGTATMTMSELAASSNLPGLTAKSSAVFNVRRWSRPTIVTVPPLAVMNRLKNWPIAPVPPIIRISLFRSLWNDGFLFSRCASRLRLKILWNICKEYRGFRSSFSEALWILARMSLSRCLSRVASPLRRFNCPRIFAFSYLVFRSWRISWSIASILALIRPISSKYVLALEYSWNHSASDHKVRQSYCYHSLDNCYSFGHNAGIMSSLNAESRILHSWDIHGLLFLRDWWWRLECDS